MTGRIFKACLGVGVGIFVLVGSAVGIAGTDKDPATSAVKAAADCTNEIKVYERDGGAIHIHHIRAANLAGLISELDSHGVSSVRFIYEIQGSDDGPTETAWLSLEKLTKEHFTWAKDEEPGISYELWANNWKKPATTKKANKMDAPSSKDWAAWEDQMPPNPPGPTLHVKGEVETPSSNIVPVLTAAAPQGINPKIFILKLTLEDNGKLGTQEVDCRLAKFEKDISPDQYSQVQINWKGAVIELLDVQVVH